MRTSRGSTHTRVLGQELVAHEGRVDDPARAQRAFDLSRALDQDALATLALLAIAERGGVLDAWVLGGGDDVEAHG
jgi:hypothetical protein